MPRLWQRPIGDDRTMAIEVHLPPDLRIGGGTTEAIGEVARRLGLARALVVTDPVMWERGPVPGLVERLEAAGTACAVYSDTQADPTVANVEAAHARLREHEADGVVAIGGGSSLDTGKGVAALAANPGPLQRFAGYGQVLNPSLPLLAVPTTAGTGSEVTRVTVITDTERGVKMMMLDDHLLARSALVDYTLTLTCPPGLTAAVGVDSLTHAIEAYVSRKATAMTDLWALEAARLIARHLRTAYSEPEDEPAREAMSLGATLGGMAFSNASVALVHGMSRPIGAHFHVPHGLSNAVLLPTVTAWSLPGAPGRYAQLARAMGVARADDDDEAAGERLVAELERLNADLGIPALRELGVQREHFDRVKGEMAEAALESGSPAFNPRAASPEEIVALYDAIW